MIVNLLIFVLIFVRLLIGIRLVIFARENNLPNVYWLAAQFFMVAIGALFAPSVGNPLGDLSISLWVYYVGAAYLATVVTIIAFNHTTFYRNRKSPIWWYIGFCAVFTLITLYGVINSKSNYDQHPFLAFNSFGVILVWGWHGWSAFQSLSGLVNEGTVEDWVKSRYRMIVLYSIALGISAVSSFVRVSFAGGGNTTLLGDVTSLVTVTAHIVAAVLQFLVWVMPKGFRKWLNRNYEARVEGQAHDRADFILDILGTAMSDGTGMSKMMAMYSLRKTIGDEIHATGSTAIALHAVNMGYKEWLAILNHPELYIFVKTYVTATTPLCVIDKARQALAEKQSLFTLQSR